MFPYYCFEFAVEIIRDPNLHGLELYPQGRGRCLGFSPAYSAGSIARIPEDGHGEILGKASLSSSNLLPLKSPVKLDSLVTFAPGRARLSTIPLPTGLPTEAKTMGIVLVAFLALGQLASPP